MKKLTQTKWTISERNFFKLYFNNELINKCRVELINCLWSLSQNDNHIEQCASSITGYCTHRKKPYLKQFKIERFLVRLNFVWLQRHSALYQVYVYKLISGTIIYVYLLL